MDEVEVGLYNQGQWNVGPMEEKGTCQKDAQNHNAFYVIRKDIQPNSALENR